MFSTHPLHHVNPYLVFFFFLGSKGASDFPAVILGQDEIYQLCNKRTQEKNKNQSINQTYKRKKETFSCKTTRKNKIKVKAAQKVLQSTQPVVSLYILARVHRSWMRDALSDGFQTPSRKKPKHQAAFERTPVHWCFIHFFFFFKNTHTKKNRKLWCVSTQNDAKWSRGAPDFSFELWPDPIQTVCHLNLAVEVYDRLKWMDFATGA